MFPNRLGGGNATESRVNTTSTVNEQRCRRLHHPKLGGEIGAVGDINIDMRHIIELLSGNRAEQATCAGASCAHVGGKLHEGGVLGEGARAKGSRIDDVDATDGSRDASVASAQDEAEQRHRGHTRRESHQC